MRRSKHPDCPHGSSFCNNANILQNISLDPYPHDTRCGCPICPLCSPGVPCDQCNGGCVVCIGVVLPGPRELQDNQNLGCDPKRRLEMLDIAISKTFAGMI
uniref:Uncharacterized protein n=1 Tax=Octactis speculum TaxID=3111310 RepID=A0A7S2MNC6_9STRA|mmetsp:Transcript_7100/g.8781  ORF Transcript_7100/g.8781 Transcript_7100/m.8781 type:complete len:101 (+) Transcript_7100:135-437(+)